MRTVLWFALSLLLPVLALGTAAEGQTLLAVASLPNAPEPSAAVPLDPQAASSSQTAPAAQTNPVDQDIERRREEQVRKQEKQRMLGIIPNFNISYDQNVPSLTPKQKLNLAFHTAIDPYTFGIAIIDAAYSQATDDFGPEFNTGRNSAGQRVILRDEAYGQGWAGYGKRVGAAYADNFDGTMLGNAILPILLKEDPRFFRKGTGTIPRRALYAVSTTFWCKRDNGKWGPNYANVLGNLAAGGISNLYYPSADRGAGLTFERGLSVTLYGTFGGLLNEFLPDITRHFLHRDVSGRKVDSSTGTAVPASPPQP